MKRHRADDFLALAVANARDEFSTDRTTGVTGQVTPGSRLSPGRAGAQTARQSFLCTSSLRQSPAPSKYHNRRTTVDGETFDSQKEAIYWQGLKAAAAAGEISDLRRQVVFPLLAPVEDRSVMVSKYVADFTFKKDHKLYVIDCKGYRTAMYRLKAKWLRLQDGIVIQEV